MDEERDKQHAELVERAEAPSPAAAQEAAEAATEQVVVPEKAVGVVFADGKVNEFDPGEQEFRVGDVVLVDNARDLNLGRVVYVGANRSGQKLRQVKRRIGPQDWMLIRRNQKREEEAHELCLELIGQLNLPMKLIRVAYLHGGNKAIFYFSADGRVDFRELVRRLAKALHVRIEMRQIGVRDESKMLGGVGICGQMLCCCRFLNKFAPVSIKMAKNQNLSLNPQKLSGLCGRLMCCLVYEDEVYTHNRRQLPRPGQTISTPRGEGRVIDLDVPRRLVKVQLADAQQAFTLGQLAGEEAAEPAAAKRGADAGTSQQASGRQGRRRQEDNRQRTGERRGRAGAGADEKEKEKERPQEQEGKSRRKKRRSRSRSRSKRRKKKARSSDQSAGPRPDKGR